MQTYLITLTRRITEAQLKELEQNAAEASDMSLTEWIEDAVDEAISDVTSPSSLNGVDLENPDERSRFYSHALLKKE